MPCHRFVSALLACALSVNLAAAAEPTVDPSRFEVSSLVAGLKQPMELAIAPDGQSRSIADRGECPGGVRASLPASASRGLKGGSSGSSLENLTFQGHTSWEEWQYDHLAVPLAARRRTVGVPTG